MGMLRLVRPDQQTVEVAGEVEKYCKPQIIRSKLSNS